MIAANVPGVAFDRGDELASYGSIAERRRHEESGKPRRQLVDGIYFTPHEQTGTGGMTFDFRNKRDLVILPRHEFDELIETVLQ